jgi:hypothetical protein
MCRVVHGWSEMREEDKGGGLQIDSFGTLQPMYEKLMFEMFPKNSQYLSQLFTNSHENWIDPLS